MKKIIHPADERGYANHGWLEARHSFSFASWYNPEKVQFGALRVLNDDKVAPATGFSKHPHDNMEIITIPLEGKVLHRDNMGNEGIIQPGELQIMSAGRGVVHSEHNGSHDTALKLFQIWIFPDTLNVEPRYQQISILDIGRNKFTLLVGPKDGPAEAWIHQNAFISKGTFSDASDITYPLHDSKNGLYIMQIKGRSIVENEELNDRDAIGIWECSTVNFKIDAGSELLLLEVPMLD